MNTSDVQSTTASDGVVFPMQDIGSGGWKRVSPSVLFADDELYGDDRFKSSGADMVRGIVVNAHKDKATAERRGMQREQSFNDIAGAEQQSEPVWGKDFRRFFVQSRVGGDLPAPPFACLFDDESMLTIDEAADGPIASAAVERDPSRAPSIIGIGGGVGPAAGVALHSKIIENTLTDGTDQSHFEVYHLSRSSDLPDRTRFVMGLTKDNPADGLARTMVALDAAASSFRQRAVAGVPCNTFHIPAIWNRFAAKVDEQSDGRVTLVHMLEETMSLIKQSIGTVRRIGVLSTTGTRQSKVYDLLLAQHGYEAVWVPGESQAEVHEAIYNTEWGIKAVYPVSAEASTAFLAFARHLVANGAEAIILGCTEIPLALPEPYVAGTTVPLVDPVLALARALIREADPVKLRPLAEAQLGPDPSPGIEELPLRERRHSEEGEEWLNETRLEGTQAEWHPHFQGRSTTDAALHDLLLMQQREIEALRQRVSALSREADPSSDDPVQFTHVQNHCDTPQWLTAGLPTRERRSSSEF